VTAGIGGTAIVWDSQTSKKVVTLSHGPGISGIALNRDGTIIAVGGLDGVTVVRNAKTGIELARIPMGSTVLAVALDHEGRRLATASGNTAQIWDISKNIRVIDFSHGHMIWSLAFDPTGRFVATAGASNIAILWDATTGKAVSRLHHEAYVWGLVFDPDGSHIATSSQDGITRVWNLDQGQEELRVSSGNVVSDLAFGPNGAILVTGGLDKTVSAWDIKNGKELARIARKGKVGALTFSPGGSFVLSASFNTENGLWRSLSSLNEQESPAPDAAEKKSVPIGNDTSESAPGSKVWLRSIPWSVEKMVKHTCTIAGRQLSVSEWQTYLGTIPFQLMCADIRSMGLNGNR